MPTLLIVRPAGQTAADLQTCAAAGWHGLIASPFAIEPDEKALSTLAARFRRAAAVFWVSPGAVATAAPLLDFSDGLPLQITVGRASARTLQAYCPQPVLSPADGKDSEAVLRMDVWHTLPQGAEILIVRGHGGREVLAEGLRRRGFSVTAAEVYFRRPSAIDWPAVAAAAPEAAWITSAEAVRGLFAQAVPPFTQILQSLLYFTHHARVAETLYAAGAKRVAVIESLDAATLQSLHGANR